MIRKGIVITSLVLMVCVGFMNWDDSNNSRSGSNQIVTPPLERTEAEMDELKLDLENHIQNYYSLITAGEADEITSKVYNYKELDDHLVREIDHIISLMINGYAKDGSVVDKIVITDIEVLRSGLFRCYFEMSRTMRNKKSQVIQSTQYVLQHESELFFVIEGITGNQIDLHKNGNYYSSDYLTIDLFKMYEKLDVENGTDRLKFVLGFENNSGDTMVWRMFNKCNVVFKFSDSTEYEFEMGMDELHYCTGASLGYFLNGVSFDGIENYIESIYITDVVIDRVEKPNAFEKIEIYKKK